MACPPNIWTGLYHLYLDLIQQLIDNSSLSEHQAREKALRRVASMFGTRIQFLVTGGAPTPTAVLSFAQSLFPLAKFADSYGATECGAITSNGVPIREKHVHVRVMPVLEGGVVALDWEGQGLREEGTVGELWVHSPNMSSGYYKDPLQTQQCFVREGGGVDVESPAEGAFTGGASTSSVVNSSSSETRAEPVATSGTGGARMWYRTGDLIRVIDPGRYVEEGTKPPLWLPKIAVLGRISVAVHIADREGQQGVVPVSLDALEGAYSISPLLGQPNLMLSLTLTPTAVAIFFIPNPSLPAFALSLPIPILIPNQPFRSLSRPNTNSSPSITLILILPPSLTTPHQPRNTIPHPPPLVHSHPSLSVTLILPPFLPHHIMY